MPPKQLHQTHAPSPLAASAVLSHTNPPAPAAPRRSSTLWSFGNSSSTVPIRIVSAETPDGPVDAPSGGAGKGTTVEGTKEMEKEGTTKDAVEDGSVGERMIMNETGGAAGLDPLSQQILARTNTGNHSSQLHGLSIPHPHLLGRSSTKHDLSAAQEGISGSHGSGGSLTRSQTLTQRKAGLGGISSGNGGSVNRLSFDKKEKRRSSSFFNRFSLMSPRRKEGSIADSASIASFSASGFIPHHKEPIRYARVRNNGCRPYKEFGNLFLAQELTISRDVARGTSVSSVASVDGSIGSRIVERENGILTEHKGAIWCMEFSPDGKYFAAAGQDGVVRVYSVLQTSEQRLAEEDSTPDPSGGTKLRAPVFSSTPIRSYTGHIGEVLDLTWSKNNFLLSSSMDKTVRLWHLDYGDNLCVFRHGDFVTSIAFHPTDDRFFLAGSLDSVLRLWSIPDKAVAYETTTKDIITAVTFAPDGKTAIAGLLTGLCVFYETEGLKLLKEMAVRSSRGKNSKGSKITGIEAKVDKDGQDVNLLITSNDSRIRQYSMATKTVTGKIKGHTNNSSQIHARSSDDGRYIVSGSEDRRLYIWPTQHVPDDANKRPYEYFEAHDDIITVAMMAPISTKILVGASDDPVFDLCNPPPITLMPRSELNDDEVPRTSKRLIPNDPAAKRKAEHPDGNIIVSSDRRGVIRVWRQDCAAQKRRQENGASQRLSSITTLTRTGSIMTRSSVGAGLGGSMQRGKDMEKSQEAIHVWREGVKRDGGRMVSIPTSQPVSRPVSAGNVERATTEVNTGEEATGDIVTPVAKITVISDGAEGDTGSTESMETESKATQTTEEVLEADGEKKETTEESMQSADGFIGGFFSRWKGRGFSMGGVATAAISAANYGFLTGNKEQSQLAVTSPTDKEPHDKAGMNKLSETPADKHEDVKRKSFEEKLRKSLEVARRSLEITASDDDELGTTPTPRGGRFMKMGRKGLGKVEEDGEEGEDEEKCMGCGKGRVEERVIRGKKRGVCGRCGMVVV